MQGTAARWKTTLLAYSYPPGVPSLPCREAQAGFEAATPGRIRTLFGREPARCGEFLRFVEEGAEGLFLVQGGICVSSGWYSAGGNSLPWHVPESARRRAEYWIFHCRTIEEYRSQGCFRWLLLGMVRRIRAQAPAARIHIDVVRNNQPARRAVLKAGFQPCGIITSCKIGVPRTRWRAIFGPWDRQAEHPAMSTNQESQGAAER